mgnify:FL=1
MLRLLSPLVVVMLLVGCASFEPLVPEPVFDEIAAVDRERNYDLAWQEIATLNGMVERGDLDGISELTLVITARMHRLELGEPDRLDDRTTWQRLEEFSNQATRRDLGSNLERLGPLSAELREVFDAGDFERAVKLSLHIYAVAQLVDTGPRGDERP